MFRNGVLTVTLPKLAPSASETGLKGWSIEPNGVDLVIFPSSDVGEYCPFVSP